MTIEAAMFTQQAISGKAQLVPDPANTFISQVISVLGAQTDLAISPATLLPCALHQISIAIPDAATTTYTYLVSDKIEIVDVICLKKVAGAANTVQVKDGAGNAISDAMATAVDKTITRAGTLDVAFNPVTGISTFQITATRAAGSMLCAVTIVCRRRAP